MNRDDPNREAGRAWWWAVLRTERDRRLAAKNDRPMMARNLGRLLERRLSRAGSGLSLESIGQRAGKENLMSVKSLTYDVLRQAVANAAAFRCRRRLQPAGGDGDKVFPPTFAGAVYAVEQRRVPGRAEPVTCVVLDTVQSQANRMEEALQAAVDGGEIKLPMVVVDFTDAKLPEAVDRISALQAPHRIADAILRDSEHEKKPFRESAVGREIDKASNTFATPLLRLCPTALVFGMWDSTGPKGGLGTKFERAVVSEVVGVNAAVNEKNYGIRRDPLGIRAAVKVQKESPTRWKIAGDAKAKGALSPSEINHSSVPFDSDNGGVTVEYAEQTTTLSLIALRRLRFPIDGKPATAEADTSARAMLAALGLCSAALAFGPGMDLRSRCVLFPEGPMEWELLATPGATPARYTLDTDSAVKLLNDAAAAVTKAGLPWDVEPVVLTPSKQLVELVRKSQELAVTEPAND